MRLKNEISDIRHELDKLIEIRETLSDIIFKVSRRLDLMIVEYTGKTENKYKEG